LKLQYAETLSNFAFNLNLRRYNEVVELEEKWGDHLVEVKQVPNHPIFTSPNLVNYPFYPIFTT
jgi:hypothetical protein